MIYDKQNLNLHPNRYNFLVSSSIVQKEQDFPDEMEDEDIDR